MTIDDVGTVGPPAPGTEVEVLTRFEPHWTTGFAIAAVDKDDRLHLRRHSDGTVLPASFGAHEVRPRHDGGARSSSDSTSIPASRNASAVTPDPGRKLAENVPS